MRQGRSDNKPMRSPWRRTLYIMFFAQTVTSIGFSSIFPFLPLYVTSLGSVAAFSTDLLSGLVFSSTAFTMMIASPIWGALADRWGRKLMVERAMFGGAVILALMAFARNAEELVLLRAVQGTITGTIGAANALVAAVVPRERTGYAMGLMQVAMGCGVGIGPVIGGMVADAWGYRAAFYVTGTLLAIAGVIVFFWVDEPPVPSHPAGGTRDGFWGEWRRIFFTPGVMPVFTLRFMNQMGRMVFIPILPLFAVGLLAAPDHINSFTGLVIGIASAATAVCAVFFGRMGDRSGHRRIIIVGSLFCVIFFLLQSRVTEGWQLLLLQALVGVSLGGIIPGVSALLATYTRQGEEGAVYGLDNSIVSGARVVGPMLGVGIGMWIGFRSVFVFAALLYTAAAMIAAWGLPGTVPEKQTTGDKKELGDLGEKTVPLP